MDAIRLHIGRDGTPRNCVAKEGNCPLANPLAHFEARGTAEEFADRYNELYSKGYDFVGLNPDEDIKELEDVKLVYISDHIKENAKKYDEYSDYHNKVRWQITNRNNAIKELKKIDTKTRKDLDNLEVVVNRERDLRFQERERDFSLKITTKDNKKETISGRFYPKSDRFVIYTYQKKEEREFLEESPEFKEFLQERKKLVDEYNEKIKTRRSEMKRITEYVKPDKKKYEKQLKKKKDSEEIIYEYMEKRIKNRAILDIEEAVDNEIETRLLERGKIVK